MTVTREEFDSEIAELNRRLDAQERTLLRVAGLNDQVAEELDRSVKHLQRSINVTNERMARRGRMLSEMDTTLVAVGRIQQHTIDLMLNSSEAVDIVGGGFAEVFRAFAAHRADGHGGVLDDGDSFG